MPQNVSLFGENDDEPMACGLADFQTNPFSDHPVTHQTSNGVHNYLSRKPAYDDVPMRKEKSRNNTENSKANDRSSHFKCSTFSYVSYVGWESTL